MSKTFWTIRVPKWAGRPGYVTEYVEGARLGQRAYWNFEAKSPLDAKLFASEDAAWTWICETIASLPTERYEDTGKALLHAELVPVFTVAREP